MRTEPSRARPALSGAELVARLAADVPPVVALSGGVDSALVASLAHEAFPGRAIAVTLTGTAVASAERASAEAAARAIGITHVVLPGDPITSAAYRSNGDDRCYHCRTVETRTVLAWGRAHGRDRFLDGVHLDDLTDDRPGVRALDEAGFLHPLVDAGWGKARIRLEARRRALPNWDRPSNACLASRVARGEPIDAELLGRIERAEALVAAEGFRRVRVRVSRGAARIEVDPAEVERLAEEPLASRLVAAVRGAGFDPVSIAPRGYGGTALPVVP